MVSSKRYDVVNRSLLDAQSKMSRVPIAIRQALTEQADMRDDISDVDLQEQRLLDQVGFQTPIIVADSGAFINQNRTDPRLG